MEKAVQWSSYIYFHLSSMFMSMKLTVVWIFFNDHSFAVVFFLLAALQFRAYVVLLLSRSLRGEQEKPVRDKIRTLSFYSCQVYL